MFKTETAVAAGSTRFLPAFGAAMLGLALVLGTAFAPSQSVHNAAHDARHSAALPCH